MGNTKKIAPLFFVALFMSYYAGTTFFSHSHIISGVAVSHSHIHAETHHDTNSGNHTEQCITLIAQISNIDYIDFSCNFNSKTLQLQLPAAKFAETAHWITSIHLENTLLRAPPILV